MKFLAKPLRKLKIIDLHFLFTPRSGNLFQRKASPWGFISYIYLRPERTVEFCYLLIYVAIFKIYL
jgi:hypothetical protein